MTRIYTKKVPIGETVGDRSVHNMLALIEKNNRQGMEAENLRIIASVGLQLQKNKHAWQKTQLHAVNEVIFGVLEKANMIGLQEYKQICNAYPTLRVGSYWRQEPGKFPEITTRGNNASLFYATKRIADVTPKDEHEKIVMSKDGTIVTGALIETHAHKRDVSHGVAFWDTTYVRYNIGDREGSADELRNDSELHVFESAYEQRIEDLFAFAENHFQQMNKKSKQSALRNE